MLISEDFITDDSDFIWLISFLEISGDFKEVMMYLILILRAIKVQIAVLG